MPSLIDLRRRIRAVKSTQQITKAMKMIAASRLKRAQDRVIAARPFAQRMLQVLNGLVSRVDQDAHPLLRIPRRDRRPLLIVDHGRSRPLRQLQLQRRSRRQGSSSSTKRRGATSRSASIGRKGRDFFRGAASTSATKPSASSRR
jgi:F-type H+-transporting ATPase subunit gamma